MIPVNEPVLTDQDFEYLKEAFSSGWISSAGKYIEKFEQSWAEYCGMKHGISVSNGTAAIQLALDAAGIGAGDEVIMPSFTIISCGQAVTNLGATPVLIDSDANTWCMDVTSIESRVTRKTKVIMVVHMYGHPVDMDVVMAIAKKHNILVIEDAAEVHGARYLSNRGTSSEKWLVCGGIGDISTFSFFANKLITTGEGGMILTSDTDINDRAVMLRNLCFNTERRFLHYELGYNYRLTNMQAAIGVSQIQRIEDIVDRKIEIGRYYQEQLSQIEGIQLQKQEPWAKGVFWINGLVLDDWLDCTAEKFCDELRKLGVDTRPFFLGMHEQPVFSSQGLFIGEQYPVSERIARQGFYLPSGLSLTIDQVDEVIKKFKLVIEQI